jgi:hypothetical protein
VSSVCDRDIAQGHVAGEFDCQNFVGASSALAARQRFAGEAASAGDGDVFQSLAPNEAVVEVAVAEILELVPLVRLRRIV